MVGSKTFKLANLFYFDEFVDTGIDQELAIFICYQTVQTFQFPYF